MPELIPYPPPLPPLAFYAPYHPQARTVAANVPTPVAPTIPPQSGYESYPVPVPVNPPPPSMPVPLSLVSRKPTPFSGFSPGPSPFGFQPTAAPTAAPVPITPPAQVYTPQNPAPLIECQRCNQAQEIAAQAQVQAEQQEEQAQQTCQTCVQAAQQELAQQVPPAAQKHFPPGSLIGPQSSPAATPSGRGPELAPLIENPALTQPVTIPAATPTAPSGAPALFTQGEANPANQPSQAQVQNPVKICVACTSTTEAAKFLNGEPSECSVVNQ